MCTIDNELPVFTISAAAKILNISVATLRMYEREGLFIPFKKKSSQRLFSKDDIERIEFIRRLINDDKISINGIKTICSLIPCWSIVGCSPKDMINCKAYNGHNEPCWSYPHPDTVCEIRNCRDCEVYNKFSQGGEIKELIKSVTNKKTMKHK